MDEEVLSRIIEIFPLVYLRDLPKSKVIAKLLARGIIMEKCKKKPVSWASEFAGTSNRNQLSKWLKKVELCLVTIAKIIGSNNKEIYKAKGIDNLLHDPSLILLSFGRPWSTLKRKWTLKYKMDETYEIYKIVQNKAKSGSS